MLRVDPLYLARLSQENPRQTNTLLDFDIPMPQKLKRVFKGKARYRCAYGGRGCVGAETLLATPGVPVAIEDFQGGPIYSKDDEGKIVTAIATKPKRYEPEQLYKVTFSDGSSIRVTANHRFWDGSNWVKTLDLCAGDIVPFFFDRPFPSQLSASFSHLQTSLGTCLSGFFSSVQHCLEIIRDWRCRYSRHHRQYDELPLWLLMAFQDVQTLQGDAFGFYQDSLRWDGQEREHKYNHLCQVPRLCTEGVAPFLEVRGFAVLESCIDDKLSGQSWQKPLFSRLSRLCINPLGNTQGFSDFSLPYLLGRSTQAESLSMLPGIVLPDVPEILGRYSLGQRNSFCRLDTIPDLHNTRLRVESVEPDKVEHFYDVHVPIYSNYLTANGVCHHNSGKSVTFCNQALLRGAKERLKILCCRELQNSIQHSMHAELVNAIEATPELRRAYRYGRSFISGHNGTEFIFKGLRSNINEIQSLQGIDICIVEEAEGTSAQSWIKLVPTIRKAGSEIWVIWNPEDEDSEVNKRFVYSDAEDIKIVKINWQDNPWFTDALERERLEDKKMRPELYPHIWDGECLRRTDAQVLADKWCVQEFEPQDNWEGPYYGVDWGFANDPTVAIKCWRADGKIWVEYESWALQLPLDQTAQRWREDVPMIYFGRPLADNARPESIQHVKRKGIPNLKAAAKWPGSVEDGIAYLRHEGGIVVHPRCVHTEEECRKYSYKIDQKTNEVLPVLVDSYNHCIDAIRYALQPLIKAQGVAYGSGRSKW